LPLKESPTKTLRVLIVAVAVLAALAAWGLFSYESSYAERIYPGVSAFSVSLGGKTREEARAALQSRLNPKQMVSLRDGAQRYMLTLAELGIGPDVDVLLDAAFVIGRQDGWIDGIGEQLYARLNGKSVSAALVMDEGAAQVALKRLARQLERAPRDATVSLIGAQVVSEPPITGRALDVSGTLDNIRQALQQPPGAALAADLAMRSLPPLVGDAGDAASQMRAILSAPLRLTLNDQSWNETGKSPVGLLLSPIQQERQWTLDTVMLASLARVRQAQTGSSQASLVVSFDDLKLTAFLSEIGAQIERKPRDARFYFDEKTGKLSPLIASQEGRTLDVPATLQRIKAQALTDNRIVPLVVQSIKPTIALEDVDLFNIHELVVSATTSFYGSSPERVQNIGVATRQFNGVVVAPGQEFSFNEYLGDVLDANGYEPAFVIIGDRTDVGIGGGVCQVSTTAFRAAFFGGFKITQRWAHGYTVHYYEPPVGLDATVYAPLVDFRFVNDTPNYLLIQPSMDIKANTLTFKFFGTKNNRTIEMDGPTISKVIPHGPDVYEKDPTIPSGMTKQVDFSADGKTVVINRTVKEGDQVLYKDRFTSNYRPWQARFLVGTKK
jgi:vancomycin resistance protein YoaR